MADPRFFIKSGLLKVSEIIALTGSEAADGAHGERVIEDVASLDRATPFDISFLDNPKYVESFAASKAGAAFVRVRYKERAPPGMAVLITEDPYRAYALVAQKLYPAAPEEPVIAPSAVLDPTARIGPGCAIGAGAYVGKNAEIGARCVIGPNAVIHDGAQIGEDTRIGALSSISHAIIGARVIIHRGAHIGQDGFGFALGREGHVKVPQLGRVIIEDDVEIGAGTCIDRGTGPDTVIGRGAKIDNLVQIGHNVQVGRGAIIVAQVGISGSTKIGDGAVLAGQAGVTGHLRIGAGARIAAQSGVMTDVPPGASYGGSPALPARDWHKQTVALGRLIKTKKQSHDDE